MAAPATVSGEPTCMYVTGLQMETGKAQDRALTREPGDQPDRNTNGRRVDGKGKTMRVSFQRGSAAILGLVTVLISTGGALAHHPMGGVTPATAWQGFLSGVGHPVIGLDHLAFIVAVGLVAGILGSAFLIPLAFIAGTAGGMVLHLASINLPLAEIVIALTVLVAGALVASGRSMSIPAWAGLAAFAGLFHGFAYGEAVFGAETTPIIAYLAGFAFIQFVIASGVAYLVRSARQDTLVPRLAGAAVAGIGFVFLAEHLLPF